MTTSVSSHRPSQLTPVARAAAIAIALAGVGALQVAQAGPGFVDATMQDGSTTRLQTYFAYSPSGDRLTPVDEDAAIAAADGRPANYTGRALRKFIDPLPLPALPGSAAADKVKKKMADGVTDKYIPVAVTSKWVSANTGAPTGDDYYEIGLVEYTDRFHSDLKKRTTLRGYVQIDHLATNGRGSLPGSKQFKLTYPDGSPIRVAATDAKGFRTGEMVQALAVEEPRFLGPIIHATKDVATRMKFHNLLPAGRAESTVTQDAEGKNVFKVTKRNGDIFLPLDKSIVGSGIGPDGFTEYTQNRSQIHLHGGDTPWISDGTPHQWITPIGEADPTLLTADGAPLSLAAKFADANRGLDPQLLPDYLRGAGASNVPDMPDPGPGAVTYYYPNGQTARTMWYHDHTFGVTRLNVYSGMASGYLLTDAHDQALITSGTLPPAERTVPLVLQDRTFVPDDISLQDARWNTSAWGEPGDSWFPHVYETVQDPAQANNWNAVGRWHYGPWFWPVYPSLYPMPEGTYSGEGYENTTTVTPEAWMDTPIINGVAYPVMEVDPTTYRFKILNASNDRMFTFNFFESKASATLADGSTVTNAVLDANGVAIPSEVDMVPASIAATPCPAGQLRPSVINKVTCTPDFWPTDNRDGGMPSPASVGPTIYQIGSEGGFLPKPVAIEPSPITYLQDKGRVNVLNVNTKSLFLAPAERADVVVDFSAYAGKTLILYNDSGAPIPASDPRNETFTGYTDQSGAGGAESTQPGYGPNSRTMMLVRVKAVDTTLSTPLPTLNVATLNADLSAAYLASQDRPVVAQPAYAGFDTSWATLPADQTYASIYTATVKQPEFKFTPGRPDAAVNGVDIVTPGSGYVQAPLVTIDPPAAAGGKAATATASMKVDQFIVVAGGSGYTTAPLFTITGGGGNGATGTVTLGINRVAVTNGGSGYTVAPIVNFSAPPAGGTKPVATATVLAGKVTAITISTPGKGYSAAPLVSITRGVGDTTGLGAKATSSGFVDAVKVDTPDPAVPSSAGGGAYVNFDANTNNAALPAVTYTFTGGAGTGADATARGKVFNISLTHPGVGYAAAEKPLVKITAAPAGGVTATAKVNATQSTYLVKNKGIQELFDPTYGRLNATFSVELPYTSAMSQTTIPLGYVDETTEKFADGETQIWKITHNGVDTHPIHFHLLNVQVVNRVGWDGYIMPPLDNELGWKETVKMSPLEDVIVAVKAKRPPLPGFGLPESIRPADPSQPLGSPFGFSQIDPFTGLPKVVTNEMVNYGWEYTWHCHILGHEENDFMRPWKFDAKDTLTKAPGKPVYASGTLSWADATPYGSAASLSDPSSEVGFRVERNVSGEASYSVLQDGLMTVRGMTGQVNTLANATSYVDKTPVVTTFAPPTPVGVPGFGPVLANQVTLTWAPPVAAAGTAPVASFNVYRAQFDLLTDALISDYVQINTVPVPKTAATSYSHTDAAVMAASVYRYKVEAVSSDVVPVLYRVAAVNVKGENFSTASDPVNFPTPVQVTQGSASDKAITPLYAPTLGGSPIAFSNSNGNTATFTWNAVTGAAGYQVRWKQATTSTGGAFAVPAAWTAVASGTSFTATGITASNFVTFEVQALNAVGVPSSSATAQKQFVVPGAIAGNFTATTTSSGVALSWTALTGATGYQVQFGDTLVAAAAAAWVDTATASAAVTGCSANQAGCTLFYNVRAVINGVAGPLKAGNATVTTLANAVATAPTVTALTPTTLTLNWVTPAGANAPTRYTVQRAANAAFTGTVTTIATNVTGLSQAVTGLTANTTYFFRVVALNSAGVANNPPLTGVASQLTLPAAPAGVTAVRGAAGGTIDGGLSWTNVTGLTYELQWAAANTMAGATLVSPATNGGLITVGGAARNVFMQVRAVNASGAGAWSAVTTVGAR
ncbi:MAG: fibronectin type III domain-containing protein [Leptothrix sp. (in: b-proteobacteria)]